MKILVLGGNGFLGSHIVDKFVASSHDVVVFCRSQYRFHHPKVTCFVGDFSDSAVLSKALQGVEVVVHAISSTVPSTSNLDPIADIQQNLISTVRLLQLMIQANIHRLVYISSGGTVYGNPDYLPVNELHPVSPICSYGIVKLAIEKYIGMYQELYGLKPIILRLSNPYGPRQSSSGVQGALTTFLLNTIKHKNISIWGDGETRRGYIYIDDFTDICSQVIDSKLEGIFNVDSGQSHSLNEIIKTISSITGINPNVEYLPERPFDVKEIFLDIEKTKNAFNWSPKYSLHEGVAKFYSLVIEDSK